MSVVVAAAEVLAQALPDPGSPLAPPGSQGILTMMRWGLWIVFACCMAGLLMVAGKVGMDHKSGIGGGEAIASLWKPAVGLLIASNITGIGAALVTF